MAPRSRLKGLIRLAAYSSMDTVMLKSGCWHTRRPSLRVPSRPTSINLITLPKTNLLLNLSMLA